MTLPRPLNMTVYDSCELLPHVRVCTHVCLGHLPQQMARRTHATGVLSFDFGFVHGSDPAIDDLLHVPVET